MKINNTLMDQLKTSKFLLPCVPVIMRKCNGFIIETYTEEHTRELLFNILKDMSDSMNIYGLRHIISDWSKPYSVANHKILVNRFGWFITQDNMEFPKDNDEIILNSRNLSSYNITKNIFINSYNTSAETPLYNMINNYDTIITNMKK